MTPPDRLDSWKEIAAYLGKGVRTVQRWETTEGLPVHRLGQKRTGSTFAYKSELDAWWQQQSGRLSEEPLETNLDPVPVRRRKWTLLAMGAGLLGLAVAAAFMVAPSQRAGTVRRPLPLTAELGWEVQPAFSPDGRQIAYVAIPPKSPGFIFIKTVGADSSTRLTGGTQPERSPAWSPDGRMIAFLRGEPAKAGAAVVLIAAAGGQATEIARLNSGSKLVWSPDGHWILGAEPVGRWPAIAAISVSTGEKHYLTEPMEFGYGGFGVSPDLARLIFSRGGPGPSAVLEISLDRGFKPVGKPRTLIPRILLREMVLTPDAKEIFYTDGAQEEGIGLWRLRLSANAKPELIHGTSDRYWMPALSPDLRRLAFAVDHSYRVSTWKLGLDERPPKAVPLLLSTHSDQNPDYSPDGRQIAFHSTRTGTSDIWVADRDGSNARRLTFTNARTTATPRWSPDGGWIAFESNESGQTDVYVIRSNGGPVRRLTHDAAIDAIPSWSRDGRTIYFCSNRTGRFEIWKSPAFGGQIEQVTRHGGFTAVESLDGKFLYYTQTRNFGPLFRLPIPSGEAEQVIPDVRGLFYAVAAEGVYFQSNGRIWQWRAATKETTEIYTPSQPMGFGIAVSADPKELLFTQIDAQQTDLYMLDGLRE